MAQFFLRAFPKISTYYKNSTNWLALSARFCDSAPQSPCHHQRRRIKALNTAHETNFYKASNKAILDQCNTLWLVRGKGNQGSRSFFYRHFPFSVIRSKCFYSRSSSPNSHMRSTEMRISIQYKVHKVADFLHNHWDLIPLTLAAAKMYQASNKPHALPPKLTRT